MEVLKYEFNHWKFTLKERSGGEADLVIEFTPKLTATLHYSADKSSSVTTPHVPRFFNAYTIAVTQKKFDDIVSRGQGSPFASLKRHFEHRKLNRELNT